MTEPGEAYRAETGSPTEAGLKYLPEQETRGQKQLTAAGSRQVRK